MSCVRSGLIRTRVSARQLFKVALARSPEVAAGHIQAGGVDKHAQAPGEPRDVDNHSLYQELCSSRPTDTRPRPDRSATCKGWKRLPETTRP